MAKNSNYNTLGIDELQMIIEAAEYVNSDVKLEDVLDNIVTVATNLTKADRGTLYLYDKESNELWSLIAMGQGKNEIRLKMGEGLAGYVAQSGEIVNIKDAQKDKRFNPNYDLTSGYITKSVLCFPIKNQAGEIVGVLQLLNSKNKEFSIKDEKFLTALGIHAALALQNALLLEKQRKANVEIKKVNEELQTAKDEVERFAMLRSHFLMQMSHEIRTPMNIILGSIQLLGMLTESQDGQDISEALVSLERGSERLIRTVDKILELSKLKSGTYEVNKEIIDLGKEILEPMFESYQPLADKKNLDFVFTKPPSKIEIVGDRFMVFQIFEEIVDNAIKFTDEGKVTVAYAKSEEGQNSIVVKDTGFGISEKYLPNLFEPFTQEDSGYSRRYEGNGLALALAKQYADLNDIDIQVKSEKYQGTEFRIIFLSKL